MYQLRKLEFTKLQHWYLHLNTTMNQQTEKMRFCKEC